MKTIFLVILLMTNIHESILTRFLESFYSTQMICEVYEASYKKIIRIYERMLVRRMLVTQYLYFSMITQSGVSLNSYQSSALKTTSNARNVLPHLKIEF